MAIDDKLNALASNMEAEFDSLEKGLSEIGTKYGATIEKLSANRPRTLGDPLTFINIGSDTNGVATNLVVRLNKIGTPYETNLEYSTDGVNWTDYAWDANTGVGTQITRTKVGEFIQFRNKANWTIANSVNLGKDADNYYQFVCSGRAYAAGTVLSLLGKYGAPSFRQTSLPNYCFYKLFAKPDSGTAAWLHNAPEIGAGSCLYAIGSYSCAYMFANNHIYMAGDINVLYIGQYGCYNMFAGDAYLYRAPEIRAQSISTHGCEQMFYNCTNIIEPPSRLCAGGTYAFRQMFYGCTKLKTAPILSSGMAEGIYEGMFYGCTALGSAQPAVLPAITLATGCYKQMYRGCTGIAVSPLILANSTDVDSCMEEMFYGCTALRHLETNIAEWRTRLASVSGTKNMLYGISGPGQVSVSPIASYFLPKTGNGQDNDGIPPLWIVTYRNDFACYRIAKTVTQLSSINVTPTLQGAMYHYTITQSEPVPINCSGFLLSIFGQARTAYVELVLEIPEGTSVVEGPGTVFADQPEAGYINHCVIRAYDGTAKLYVVDKEPIDSSSSI